MKKETKKSVDTTAKKKDIVENNNTDIENETTPDAVVEAKPDAAPKSKSLIIKLKILFRSRIIRILSAKEWNWTISRKVSPNTVF